MLRPPLAASACRVIVMGPAAAKECRIYDVPPAVGLASSLPCETKFPAHDRLWTSGFPKEGTRILELGTGSGLRIGGRVRDDATARRQALDGGVECGTAPR